jgi:hypothetical protein
VCNASLLIATVRSPLRPDFQKEALIQKLPDKPTDKQQNRAWKPVGHKGTDDLVHLSSPKAEVPGERSGIALASGLLVQERQDTFRIN